MQKAYKEMLDEQWGSAMKACGEVVEKHVNLNSIENKKIFATTQEAAIKAYGDLLEEQEKQLAAELGNIIMEYTSKMAAIRSLLRLMGREEEKRAGLQRELDVQGSENTNDSV